MVVGLGGCRCGWVWEQVCVWGGGDFWVGVSGMLGYTD